jgi:4-hydroxy-3-polyprenylbenzoate decarboxylase
LGYSSLASCVHDLEKHGQLIRIKETVDPNLDMAALHLAVHAQQGPALYFEKVKGSNFPAVSNLYGSLDRCRFLFRDSLKDIQQLIQVKQNPMSVLKNPGAILSLLNTGIYAQPLKSRIRKPVLFQEIKIEDLPLIKHWPLDGGAFITLPQVYSEDPEFNSIAHSNLGMYRVQLNGNKYALNSEIGLHYQIHRGIGIHHTKAKALNKKLKVSIFVGGPPAHAFAAVMPLPEGMSELNFAGALARKSFSYVRKDGYVISTDADFVICGEVQDANLPEGPFGDHLGYYSLQHPFPYLKIHKVYSRKNAIWPFTVVGRPPQEDSYFGALIHELSGNAIQHEIPGVKAVHAVDASGVHPLLFAIGTERYAPFQQDAAPLELLTQANRILGTGQLSLAKYLYICSDTHKPNIHNEEAFLHHCLERIKLERDLHFQTQTSIDTLDYSGESINKGSKLVLAAHGEPIRKLSSEIPQGLDSIKEISTIQVITKGVLALEINGFTQYPQEEIRINALASKLEKVNWEGIVQLILCNDAKEISSTFNNYLWITYTRSNPSHDVYGVQSQIRHKHWGCTGPIIIDARTKPHHAPELEINPKTIEAIKPLFAKGGSLEKFELRFS